MNSEKGLPEKFEELLTAARQGKPEALEQLFGYVRNRFRAIAAKMLRIKRDAAITDSDVIQELSVRVWKMLENDHDFSSAGQFLAAAGKHLRWAALELLRHPQATRVFSLDRPASTKYEQRSDIPVDENQRDLPERLEAWQHFHQLVGREGILEPHEREVVILRWYHGLKQSQIASVLGVSERTVKRYWHSAKAKLRQHLDLDTFR